MIDDDTNNGDDTNNEEEVTTEEEETAQEESAAGQSYQGDKTSSAGDKNIAGLQGNDGAANRSDEDETETPKTL